MPGFVIKCPFLSPWALTTSLTTPSPGLPYPHIVSGEADANLKNINDGPTYISSAGPHLRICQVSRGTSVTCLERVLTAMALSSLCSNLSEPIKDGY